METLKRTEKKNPAKSKAPPLEFGVTYLIEEDSGQKSLETLSRPDPQRVKRPVYNQVGPG